MPLRNHHVPSSTVVVPVVDVDARLTAKDPFKPVQDGLKRIAECRAQLAEVNQRARDAVAKLRDVEGQLAKQVTGESYDADAEAELIKTRDAARAALDPDLHRARTHSVEGRIQAAIGSHDRYITEHLDELLEALEPERIAAEESLQEAEEAITPIRQRAVKVHERIRELEQYRPAPPIQNAMAMVG